jgi:hypothetical protein
VIAALGGSFVQGALEEVQGGGDLAVELFLAEVEECGVLAHKCAYIYAHLEAVKSACQEENCRRRRKITS